MEWLDSEINVSSNLKETKKKCVKSGVQVAINQAITEGVNQTGMQKSRWVQDLIIYSSEK